MSVSDTMWSEATLTEEDLPKGEKSLAALARKYNTTGQEIARRNMVSWNNEAVNKWIMKVGGKMLSSGWAVFQPGNKIHLPPRPLITTTNAPSPVPTFLKLILAAGGLYVGYKLIKAVKGK